MNSEIEERMAKLRTQHANGLIVIDVPKELAMKVLAEFQERKAISEKDVEYCSGIIEKISLSLSQIHEK